MLDGKKNYNHHLKDSTKLSSCVFAPESDMIFVKASMQYNMQVISEYS